MILLLSTIILVGADSRILSLADIHANQSVDCIIQAVHVVAKRKIVLEFTNETQDIATEILMKVDIPVILNTPEHRQPSNTENRAIVDALILLKDEEPANILNDTLWNGNTRFIIVTNDEQKLEEYFELFWKQKVINVFGIVISEGNDTLYSFLPYGKNNCTKSELLIVDTCVDGRLQNGGTALEDTMRIKNMNGCPVNVTVSRITPALIFEPKEGLNHSSTVGGFEGNLMMEVAKIFNYNATYKTSEDGFRWGWILPTPRGAIGDLYRGLTDMTVGMLSAFMDRFEYLDMSTNYYVDDCVTFIVPLGYGAKRAAWLTSYFSEFSYPTWGLILFSFMAVTTNIWFINRYLKGSWLKTKVEIMLSLYSICLGVAVKLPTFLSSRVSIIFWIISGFIITAAYTASMEGMLAVPPRDDDINDFVQLLESDLQIIGSRSSTQMVNYAEYPFVGLKNRFKFSNDSVDAFIERLVKGEKIATLYSKLSYFYHSMTNPKVGERVHVLKQCINTFRSHTMLQKFSPFTNRVSQTIRRLEESGIMEMWREEYIKDVPHPKKPFLKLSLKQMFGAFCFLFVGYSVAFASFLYEVYTIFGVRRPLSEVVRWFKKSTNTYFWVV